MERLDILSFSQCYTVSLVAFDDQDKVIKHYRVDKMKNIALSEEKREGAALFKNFDMAGYSVSEPG